MQPLQASDSEKYPTTPAANSNIIQALGFSTESGESVSRDCNTETSEVAAFSPFVSHPGMTVVGRLTPFTSTALVGTTRSVDVRFSPDNSPTD